jgi:hypothetical protein
MLNRFTQFNICILKVLKSSTGKEVHFFTCLFYTDTVSVKVQLSLCSIGLTATLSALALLLSMAPAVRQAC